MFKSKLILGLSLLSFFQFSFASLHFGTRPQALRDIVRKSFAAIENVEPQDRWGFSGEAHYWLCDVNKYNLITTLIKEAPPEQTDFYFLDIGAGNFQWSNDLAESLNRSKIRPGATYHIIGLRGEKYKEAEIRKDGNCIVYSFGAFKIEQLNQELKRRNIDITNKVSLIVSRWTFKHLADPVGTLLQACNLLTPNHGILLCDGLYTYFEDVVGQEETLQPLEYSSFESLSHLRKHQTLLLSLLGVSFFEQDAGQAAAFMLKREKKEVITLKDVKYGKTIKKYFSMEVCGCQALTKLETTQWLSIAIHRVIFCSLKDSYLTTQTKVIGNNEEFLSWCKTHNLFDPRFSKKIWESSINAAKSSSQE